MEQRILNLLGLAYKAGYLVSGEEGVLETVKKKKAKIVFIGYDCSYKTLDKLRSKCYFYNTILNEQFSSEQISQSIGKMRKIVAITDDGFFNSIIKYLGGEKNESQRDIGDSES